MQELQTGTVLQGGKYRIVKKLGQGGFGITYEGVQTGLERRVAIKEFFMKDYCNRESSTSRVSIGSEGSREMVEDYRQKFLKEAQMIARMEDVPNIIRIHDIFEENQTAYYVMEFLPGGSLKQLVEQQGRLPEQQAIGYIREVGLALSQLHQRNILHLDIKPDNILLGRQGNAVLIDFGVSKHYDQSGSQTSSTPVGLSKGFAPTEQYQQGGVTQFTPATDIYSLGATLYYMLTGQTPPDANVVFEDGLPERPAYISLPTWQAITQAMQPRRKERTQTVAAFLGQLNAGFNGPTPQRPVPPVPPRPNNRTVVRPESKTVVAGPGKTTTVNMELSLSAGAESGMLCSLLAIVTMLIGKYDAYVWLLPFLFLGAFVIMALYRKMAGHNATPTGNIVAFVAAVLLPHFLMMLLGWNWTSAFFYDLDSVGDESWTFLRHVFCVNNERVYIVDIFSGLVALTIAICFAYRCVERKDKTRILFTITLGSMVGIWFFRLLWTMFERGINEYFNAYRYFMGYLVLFAVATLLLFGLLYGINKLNKSMLGRSSMWHLLLLSAAVMQIVIRLLFVILPEPLLPSGQIE